MLKDIIYSLMFGIFKFLDKGKYTMIMTVLIVGLFVYIAVGTYNQIPAEDPKTIEARKRYGKAK